MNFKIWWFWLNIFEMTKWKPILDWYLNNSIPIVYQFFLIICSIKTDIKGGKCFDLSLFEHPFLTSHLKWVGRLNLFSFLWESIRHDDLLMGRQYKVCCLFEWTPSCRKESGYPINRIFALQVGLALMVMPPSRSNL